MASMKTCTCLLVAVIAASVVLRGSAQVTHLNTHTPTTPISNYRQYLQRAGEAMGVFPVQPEAETSLSAHAPAAGPTASSGMAPMTAPAGAGQPGPAGGYVPNPDPSVQDWVQAYKPLDAAINHAFETRITKNNAVSTQFHLAEAAAPLQMLINDVTLSQGKAVSSFAQQLLTGGDPLAAATNPLAASTSITSSNPLTGIAMTATSPTTQPTTTTDGATVTATNPAAATVATTDPAAATATAAATTAAANPLGWLRVPGLGKKM